MRPGIESHFFILSPGSDTFDLVRRIEGIKACKILLGYLEGKKPLLRPNGRYEDDIKLDLNGLD
jgi:hypothetical protein